MSAVNLLTVKTDGTPKRLDSSGATIDFLSIKIGASAIEIKQTSSNLDFAGVKLVNVAAGSASGEVVTYDQRGANNGVASLDSGGKIPAGQLPNSVMEYKGVYNATTNSPSLADGSGNTGDVYRVSVAGTQDFGSGNITFVVGDYVIYNGSVWEKSHSGADAVVTVNGQSGVVVLTTDDVAEGSTNLYYTNARFDTRFGTKTTDDLTEGSTNLYFTSARAKSAAVADAINDGTTDVAPSQNAVFDALALKADAATTPSTTKTLQNDQGGSVAITVRQVVYLSAAGKVKKALATAAAALTQATQLYMVSDSSIADQASGLVYKPDQGTEVTGFSSLTLGSPIYLSRSTAGSYQQDLTGFVAGDNVISLGKVISATAIEWNPTFLFEY